MNNSNYASMNLSWSIQQNTLCITDYKLRRDRVNAPNLPIINEYVATP